VKTNIKEGRKRTPAAEGLWVVGGGMEGQACRPSHMAMRERKEGDDVLFCQIREKNGRADVYRRPLETNRESRSVD